MVQRIYLVRHGETLCSQRDVFCGAGCDATLTAQGEATAAALAEAMAVRLGNARQGVGLFVSPLTRARQTVAPLEQHCATTAVVVPELAELHYGAWDGQRRAQLAGDRQFNAWLQDPINRAPPGGESGAQVAARACQALAWVRQQLPADGQAVMLAHKSTLRLLLCALMEIPLDRFRVRLDVPLGSITTVDFLSTGPLLRSLGDISYLAPALRQPTQP